MANAVETRLAQLERRFTRRENPGAEAEAAAAAARAEAAASFDAVEPHRSELRDQHRAVLAKIRAPLSGLRKELGALQALEREDYQPYMAQVGAGWRGADRQRRIELSGSVPLVELLDRVEQLVRELEATL